MIDEQHIRDKYNLDADPLLNLTDFTPYETSQTEFELEQNKSFEIGYRSLIGDQLLIDTYYYNSVFTNFSLGANLIQGGTGTVFQTTISSDQDVQTQGIVMGLSYALKSGFKLSGNYSWNELSNPEDIPEGFQTEFNTPEHKVNLSISNRKLTDKIGFNFAWRWQDAFLWESTFAVGEVDAYSTLDLQISYALPNLKSRVKIGGSNVLNERYTQAIGNPTVGAVWYASITFDEFFH